MTTKAKCSNWLNYEAIRGTVTEYESKWGAPDGSTSCNLSELNMTENCMECNMRPILPSALNSIAQIIGSFKDPIMTKLEEVGMVRKCYKPEVSK